MSPTSVDRGTRLLDALLVPFVCGLTTFEANKPYPFLVEAVSACLGTTNGTPVDGF
jgi:hypothetical protein